MTQIKALNTIIHDKGYCRLPLECGLCPLYEVCLDTPCIGNQLSKHRVEEAKKMRIRSALTEIKASIRKAIKDYE